MPIVLLIIRLPKNLWLLATAWVSWYWMKTDCSTLHPNMFVNWSGKVRRDRNCPSVILWSVFNEEPMQGHGKRVEMVRRMYDVVKKMDLTRPITAAMNGGFFSEYNVSQAVDVGGFNYQIESYDRFHEENPDLPLTSTEDGSALMTRGEYVTDYSKNLMDSYDTQCTGWGATHRQYWKAVAERPWMAGCFY